MMTCWRYLLRRSAIRIVLLLIVGSATGCSSGEDVPSPPAFDACGGELTGTWRVVDAEFDKSAALETANARLSAACKDAFQSVTFDATGVMVTFTPVAGGSMTNAAGNKRYERTLNPRIEVTEELVVSAACVDEQFGDADCRAVGEALRTEGAAECRTGGPPCSCTVIRPVTTSVPDTVDAEGGRFTTRDGQAYEFCQQGDTLEQVGRDSSGKLVSRLRLERK